MQRIYCFVCEIGSYMYMTFSHFILQSLHQLYNNRLALFYSKLLARKPNLGTLLFIQTNSSIIFTYLNQVLLVLSFGQCVSTNTVIKVQVLFFLHYLSSIQITISWCLIFVETSAINNKQHSYQNDPCFCSYQGNLAVALDVSTLQDKQLYIHV